MRRPLVPLAAFVLLAAGCAPARTGTLGPAPVGASPTAGATATPRAPAPATTTPSRRPPPASPTTTVPVAPDESGEGGTIVVQLWFVRDGRLAPTRRTLPATVATSRLALTELAAGPSRAEAAAGLTTRVPTGVQVVRIADGVATLAPPAGFTDGGAAAVRLRRAQVVWTLTQFPTVRGVAFADAAPVGRDDYADLLPAIVVTGPSVGDRVTSPVSVTGSAEVFEATVSVRVLDATGREVGTSFTTAACGSGCRGDYRATVRYRVAATGPGTIEVYEVSPRDGSRVNVVAVPIVLVAAGR